MPFTQSAVPLAVTEPISISRFVGLPYENHSDSRAAACGHVRGVNEQYFLRRRFWATPAPIQ